MTRLILLALLLCACAAKDPKGAFQPTVLNDDPRAFTENTPEMVLVGGDNTPFRLSGGNYLITLRGPNSPEDCVGRLILRGPNRFEREVYRGAPWASVQLRDLRKGLYTPEWQPVPNTCEATIELLTQL